jgi:hypothetical protein
VADDKRSAAKRAPAKRTSAKRAPANEPATKDWVDKMNETLAKVAETARHANAAEPGADSVATRASGSRWWPQRLRGGRA